MRIGFIKLGLKTYFNKSGSGQGSNHELVDTFHIFEKFGHECVMLSNNDKHPYGRGMILDLDWIFVFNGNAPTTWETNMNMLKGSLESLKYLRDYKDIPYAYFWTDPRYDIEKNPLFKEIPPKVILSQEPQHYAHLDKLILYEKNRPIPFKKDIFFSILMNDTGETIRKKAVNNCINWLKSEDYSVELIGDWPKNPEFHSIPFTEDRVMDQLTRIKYSFNCGKKEDWVSQKYWEMILNRVICFFTNYDSANLLMHPKDTRRVVDGIDVLNNIKVYEITTGVYESNLQRYTDELKSEYFTGEFVYNKIMEKLNVH